MTSDLVRYLSLVVVRSDRRGRGPRDGGGGTAALHLLLRGGRRGRHPGVQVGPEDRPPEAGPADDRRRAPVLPGRVPGSQVPVFDPRAQVRRNRTRTGRRLRDRRPHRAVEAAEPAVGPWLRSLLSGCRRHGQDGAGRQLLDAAAWPRCRCGTTARSAKRRRSFSTPARVSIPHARKVPTHTALWSVRTTALPSRRIWDSTRCWAIDWTRPQRNSHPTGSRL